MKKLLMLTLILTASTSFLHSADAKDPKQILFTNLFNAIHAGKFESFQKLYTNTSISDTEKSILKGVATNKLTQVTQTLTETNAGKITFGKPVQTDLQTAGLEQIIAFLS